MMPQEEGYFQEHWPLFAAFMHALHSNKEKAILAFGLTKVS